MCADLIFVRGLPWNFHAQACGRSHLHSWCNSQIRAMKSDKGTDVRDGLLEPLSETTNASQLSANKSTCRSSRFLSVLKTYWKHALSNTCEYSMKLMCGKAHDALDVHCFGMCGNEVARLRAKRSSTREFRMDCV